MLYVVTGVSGSGKSEYAENLAVKISGGRNLYYAAAMQPFGEEGRERIRRHRALRAGKGFTTIECYTDIGQLPDRIGGEYCRTATVLLECMSNLLANEMFREEKGQESTAPRECGLSHQGEQRQECGSSQERERQQECGSSQEREQRRKDGLSRMEEQLQKKEASGEVEITDKLLSEIFSIVERCRHLIIVTNEVFSDSICYSLETEEYREKLAEINCRLVERSDEAVEILYTIPMRIKQKRAGIGEDKTEGKVVYEGVV